MTLRIDDDASLYVYWDATLTFDPTGSSVTLDVDGTRYGMTWQGVAVQVGTSWTRTARTDAKFVGRTVTPTGTDVQLAAAATRKTGEPIVVTADGQTVPCFPTIPIDIR